MGGTRPHGLDDRLLDDPACEGHGDEFLRRVGLRYASVIDPMDLLALHRVALDPRAPSGCRGLVELAPPRVRFSTRGSVEAIYATLAHEGGHLAIDAAAAGRCRERVARSHGEGDATRVAQAFCFPRAAVLRVLRTHGWDLARLGAICPSVPVLWAALRAAWVCDRPLLVTTGRRVIAWAPRDIVWPESLRRVGASLPGAEASDAISRTGAIVRATRLPSLDDADAWQSMVRAV